MSREISIEQRELLIRIAGFAIDEGTPELSFSGRLARENGWTGKYADRVVVEYLRFVGLAMVSGHVVTPSEQVDQAWHLHLTYTHSYWTRLCGEVLGRPLHHGPTRGGEAESRKYFEQYERTLRSYEEIFGVSPPADIWPKAEIRFGRDLLAVRVNPGDYWMISKRCLLLPGRVLSEPVPWGRVLTFFSLGLLLAPQVVDAASERLSAAMRGAGGALNWLPSASLTTGEPSFYLQMLEVFGIALLPAEFLFRTVLRAMDRRQGAGLEEFDVVAETSAMTRAESAILIRGAPRLVEAALGAPGCGSTMSSCGRDGDDRAGGRGQ